MAKIYEIKQYDVANGPGVRTSIWFTGCDKNCYGCHNKELQDPNIGFEFDEIMLAELEEYLLDPQVDGRLSVLGGEPMSRINVSELNATLYYLRHRIANLNVWIWTGHDYEYLLGRDMESFQTIEKTDVIVDGPYDINNKVLNNPYMGSSNQRVIDVQESLRTGVTVVNGSATHMS